jgi:hypothetical protein
VMMRRPRWPSLALSPWLLVVCLISILPKHCIADSSTFNVTTSPKRGLINIVQTGKYASGSADDYRTFITQPSDLKWYYNYGASPSVPIQNSGLTIGFVPMMFGAPSSTSDTTFLETVKGLITNGAVIDSVLFLNEPDQPSNVGGSNVDATTAAELWKSNIEPLKSVHGGNSSFNNGTGQIQLGGPAVSGSPNGLAWLKGFQSACSNSCSVDFLPIHWYGDFQGLASHIGESKATFPNWTQSMWITEYALPNSNLSSTQLFLNQSLQYFDRLDYVTRYSYFGSFRSTTSNVGDNVAMLDGNGRLTDIGAWYLGRDATGVIPNSKARETAEVNVAWTMLMAFCLSMWAIL